MRSYFFKVFLVCLFITTCSIQKSIAQIDLTGHWTAHCVFEMPSKNAFKVHPFCQQNKSGNHSEITYEVPELLFEKGKDYFNLITEENNIKITYVIDEELNTLEFNHRETLYKFNILVVFKHTGNSYILKSEGGGLILLEKKQNNM